MTEYKDVKNKLFFSYAEHLISGKQRYKGFAWDYDCDGENICRNLGVSVSEQYTVVCEEVKELPLKEYMLSSFKNLTKEGKQQLLNYLNNGVTETVRIYKHVDEDGYEYWSDEEVFEKYDEFDYC